MWQGLSPRVRGNRIAHESQTPKPRSIPACTGEPTIRGFTYKRPRVYPRVYGGTPDARAGTAPSQGLSPRVRGNPPSHSLSVHRLRVYPRVYGGTCRKIASATSHPRVSWNHPVSIDDTVYPRVYGGTWMPCFATSDALGLSPRVRGNLANITTVNSWLMRSIPACTGEPRTVSVGPTFF